MYSMSERINMLHVVYLLKHDPKQNEICKWDGVEGLFEAPTYRQHFLYFQRQHKLEMK